MQNYARTVTAQHSCAFRILLTGIGNYKPQPRNSPFRTG